MFIRESQQDIDKTRGQEKKKGRSKMCKQKKKSTVIYLQSRSSQLSRVDDQVSFPSTAVNKCACKVCELDKKKGGGRRRRRQDDKEKSHGRERATPLASKLSSLTIFV